MPSLNSFMEVGKRALIAYQDVLQTIGHNISNVNTEGYSRQRASLEPTLPSDNANYGQVGTGVQIGSITRARDFLIDQQVRQENSNLGKWERENTALAQIENIFNEPDDAGFNDVLSDFWDAWSDLSNDPGSTVARTVLRERTTHLTDALNGYDADIKLVEQQLNQDFNVWVEQLNNLAESIADLNRQIRTAESIGQNANDLRDKRDLLLDDVSEIIDMKYTDNADGTANIYINGQIFVQERDTRRLITTEDARNGIVINNLIWEDNRQSVDITGGKLEGIVKTRDIHAEQVRDRLDELALTIAEEVNTLHLSGYNPNGGAGVYFFDSETTGAADIRLSNAILSDTNNIAAGYSTAPGDNSAALDIAALPDQLIMNNGKGTFGDFYSSAIADLGARKMTAEMYEDQAEAVSTQLKNLRQSVQGVMLDEELTEMIKFQRSYNAAAQIVNAASEMMNTIITLGK